MKKEHFDGIMRAMEEAMEYVETGKPVEGTVVHAVPVSDVDVRALRSRFNLSRPRFAARFGLDARAIQDWEQGRRRPDKATRAYLKVIEREPDAVIRALAAAE